MLGELETKYRKLINIPTGLGETLRIDTFSTGGLLDE